MRLGEGHPRYDNDGFEEYVGLVGDRSFDRDVLLSQPIPDGPRCLTHRGHDTTGDGTCSVRAVANEAGFGEATGLCVYGEK